MQNRFRLFFSLIMLVSLLVGVSGVPISQPVMAQENRSLVAVSIADAADLARFEALNLPVYQRLQGREGGYLLTGVSAVALSQINNAGLHATVLDADISGAAYYLAYPLTGQTVPLWNDYGQVLLDDGIQVLLRLSPEGVDRLQEVGADLVALTLDPKPLHPIVKSEIPTDVTPDPLIQAMMDQVTQTDVYNYTGGLSGEWPVTIGGSPYTIYTRNTNSGTPIQMATQFVGEHFADLGLGVEYHQWSGPTYPNVIAELPGLTNPDDIYIIGAHLDNMPSSGNAPGADDNGSGSVATLLAADILSQYQWGCTLRFALWTGEEQGLNGSAAYAQRSFNQGENILGYLNLDMIAWNSGGSSPDIDLHSNSSVPGAYEIAELYVDTVDAYGLNLVPAINPNGTGASDHASFWNYGYPAILAIEDGSDFNPYYHTINDDMDNFEDWPYYVEFVKASIGAFAHLTGCLIPSGLGALDGYVTAATGGAPIADATVSVDDGAGNIFTTVTDASGYYTRTLMTGSYTVTASAYGYLPSTVTGVPVMTDTVTSQDFSLATAPTFVVSGTVTEVGTGNPLLAQIDFEGSPVSTLSNPVTGYYSATLPQGDYVMHVRANLHRSQERAITVDGDQTQNFVLEPTPPILLVDDDDNGPDVQAYYTEVLDAMGLDYDIWDTGNSDDEPDATELAPYEAVIWFTGDEYGGAAGPGSAGESALESWLDSGKCLFLSSQDYYYDRGLTSFMQTYLGVASATSDSGDYTSVTGQGSVFSGYGPYTLDYPFNDYSDIVVPDGTAEVAFGGNNGNDAAVNKAGGAYQTTFWAYPYEAIPDQVDRQELMAEILDWCDLGAATGTLTGEVTDAGSGDPIAGAEVTVNGMTTSTTANGMYALILPVGSYPMTVTHPDYFPGNAPDVTIYTDTVTIQDIELIFHPQAGITLTPGNSTRAGLPGELTVHNFTLENTGNFTDSFSLSVSGYEWGTSVAANTGALAAGEVFTVAVSVSVPIDPQGRVIIASDSFTLTAVSAIDASVNATVLGTTHANVEPGVAISPESQSGVGGAGEVVTYTFTISNTGDYTDTFALSVTSAWTATLSAASTGAVGAGESVSVVLTVAIPADAAAEASEVATLTAVSGLDGDVRASATAETTVLLTDFRIYLPVILR